MRSRRTHLLKRSSHIHCDRCAEAWEKDGVGCREANFHRNALHDLYIIASRVLGRKETGSIACRGGHVLDLPLEGFVERIHLNGGALADVHLAELRLLKVGGRPYVFGLYDHDQLLPHRNSAPNFRGALGRDPIDRRKNVAVAQIQKRRVQPRSICCWPV